MIVKRYETRIDDDGLVSIEKVWSKQLSDITADTQFRDPNFVHHFLQTSPTT